MPAPRDRAALVKAARFRCCCSNFGGVNGPDTDPFGLLRIPISPWYASPHQFGFDVALGRSVLAESGGVNAEAFNGR